MSRFNLNNTYKAIVIGGSAGSFQGIDARPGFSINCSKYKGGDRFHGLKRFQLNNCAQDGTALNELVCGEIARAAGVAIVPPGASDVGALFNDPRAPLRCRGVIALVLMTDRALRSSAPGLTTSSPALSSYREKNLSLLPFPSEKGPGG